MKIKWAFLVLSLALNSCIDNDTIYQAPPPYISPEEFDFGFSEPILVTITGRDKDAVFYTLDSSEPDSLSERYTEPFYVGSEIQSLTVKARSYADGNTPSSVAERSYIFFNQQTFAPRFNFDAGTYNEDISVELFTYHEQAEIYYNLSSI